MDAGVKILFIKTCPTCNESIVVESAYLDCYKSSSEYSVFSMPEGADEIFVGYRTEYDDEFPEYSTEEDHVCKKEGDDSANSDDYTHVEKIQALIRDIQEAKMRRQQRRS